MSNIEIIITILVLVAVVGQLVFIQWCRRKTFFDSKHTAKARARLIEREYDKQTGDGK